MFFNEILGISDHIFLSVVFSSIRLVKCSKSGGQVNKTYQICYEQSIQHDFNTFLLLIDAKKYFQQRILIFSTNLKANNWNLPEQR